MNPLVIIGTGLAGYNLAKEFRKKDSDRPLIMITSDDGHNYSKPMLSTGFTKEKAAAELSMGDGKKMAETLNADIRIFSEVTAVDTKAQTITVDDETISYGDLVFAQGAAVFRPPMEGDGQAGVYSVNDLSDYAKFREAIQGKKKVLIIGAGLIGCEFANDLSNGGFDVEVVDPVDRPLQMLIPKQASAAVKAGLESLGTKFHFGVFAKAVNKTDTAYSLTLSDDREIEGDIILSAVGLRPRIQLAQEAGIEVNRGIIANRLLETSAKHVYAIGDCAEIEGHVLLYVLPLMACARSLANTLSGNPTPISYPAMPVAIKTPVCPVITAPPAIDAEGSWKEEVDGANVVAKFVDASGNLLGFALTGEGTKQKMALQKELPPLLV
jgi:rubredoxin-NAD+ reductase